jgi:hypothetical protein
MNHAIHINLEMQEAALNESKKREEHIKHHFEVKHLSSQERNMIGFLGEFACCELLGLDWRQNIRKDYLTIDEFDINFRNKRIDVKTETIPHDYLTRILNKQINDDDLYGRRLINKGQYSLLEKYDIVIFGAMNRDDLSAWYPLGWLSTSYILQNYKPTSKRGDGGYYPFPGLPVHTSKLNPMEKIKNV